MLVYAEILVQMLIDRVRAVRSGGADRGASALEWAIIAAIAVVAASVIGAVVYNVVTNKGDKLQQCADQPVGAKCGG